jgi:hypothetical protein
MIKAAVMSVGMAANHSLNGLKSLLGDENLFPISFQTDLVFHLLTRWQLEKGIYLFMFKFLFELLLLFF